MKVKKEHFLVKTASGGEVLTTRTHLDNQLKLAKQAVKDGNPNGKQWLRIVLRAKRSRTFEKDKKVVDIIEDVAEQEE